MGVIELLKKGMNIGVPASMPPEEARPIRFLNVFTILNMALNLFIFFLGGLSLFKIIPPLQASYTTPLKAIFIEAFIQAVSFSILYMNHRGRYQLARNYFIIIGILFFSLVPFYLHLGKGTREHFFLIGILALAAVIYPKKNSSIMYYLIVLSVIFFLVVEFFGPEYANGKASPDAIIVDILFIVFMTILILASRYSTTSAEDRLIQSQKKIAALSAKLKVFIPHQFVQSLEKGEADSTPDYERRRLTIFFSDVKGFTTWTDKLEPEDTRELLNQYLSEMSKITHKWGGTIDKFIGDAIMIFFGAPEFTNDKDHAVRCVKMAMEMQEKMKELRDEWEDLGHEESLRIRIGINTGYATVGTFGSEDRLDYTVLGSTVNLASRLETASEPDRITISHATYSLIKNEIECESKGTIDAKGFPEPVKIYEVVGNK